MKAGLCCQQHAAMAGHPEKQGGHPGPSKSWLVFLGWLKPPITNCILDAELSPARGQPVAHPAIHHLKAAKALSAVIQLNPQSPTPASKVAFSCPFNGLSKWPSLLLNVSLLRGWVGLFVQRDPTWSNHRSVWQQIQNWHLSSSF